MGKECILIPDAVISGNTICDVARKTPESSDDFKPELIVPEYLRKSEAEIRHKR
jgi:hypothetical protein